MPGNARKIGNLPSIVCKLANHEVATQAGAIITIGLGWACLYFAVTQSLLME